MIESTPHAAVPELAVLNQSINARHRCRSRHACGHGDAGCDEREIAKTAGHKSRRMLPRYIRSGKPFHENAASTLGL
ncbi:MAG: hypothetical protein ACLPH3_24345 [Terracidiphilus sp.]